MFFFQVEVTRIGKSRILPWLVIGSILPHALADKAQECETLIDDKLFIAEQQNFPDAPLILEVKGFEKQVLAHRFLGFQDQAPKRRMIGRDNEVEKFQNAISQIAKKELGKTIFLLVKPGSENAPAGRRYRIREKSGFQCYSTLILDFGQAEALSPIYGLVRDLCGLGDAPEEVAIRNAVGGLLDENNDDESFGLFLTNMLGGELDLHSRTLLSAMNEQTQIKGQQAALRRFAQKSVENPLLLAVEDLHWAEEELLLYKSLITETQRKPILLVVTSRLEGPIFLERIPNTIAANQDQIIFEKPLTDADAKDLARQSLSSSNERLQQCIKRAQGNPLFLDQLLRHLDEDPEGLPGSIQSLIQNRFDRLAAADRRVFFASKGRFWAEVYVFCGNTDSWSGCL